MISSDKYLEFDSCSGLQAINCKPLHPLVSLSLQFEVKAIIIKLVYIYVYAIVSNSTVVDAEIYFIIS